MINNNFFYQEIIPITKFITNSMGNINLILKPYSNDVIIIVIIITVPNGIIIHHKCLSYLSGVAVQ